MANAEVHAQDASGVWQPQAGPLAKDGTDGASPPSIPGTGIRGWLRSIYDRLAALLYLQRSSEKSGRTHVQANLAQQTAGATVRTVAAGKTLYVTSLVFSGFNTATSAANLHIRDGASTTVLPITMPAAGTGLLSSAIQSNVNGAAFADEPLQFTTDVRIVIVAGTVTYSVLLVGYEE